MTIKLENMRLYGYHGVLPQEKCVGAEFEVDVEICMPPAQGCYTDTIIDTINYAEIYKIVNREFNIPSDLLEHVVERIADAISNQWPAICSIKVKLTKLAPPIPGFNGKASVTLESVNKHISYQ